MDSNNIYSQWLASQNSPLAKESMTKEKRVKLVCWTEALKNTILLN